MVVEPEATPVASPVESIVATVSFELAQVAVELISAVEPSLYFAVAVNCCVAPIAMPGVVGDNEIEVIVLDVVTVSVAVPLTPLTAAVTIVEPAATAVASPVELTVATAVFAAVQLAVELIFAVEPSLYVAVAVNCCVAPTAMLVVTGDNEIAVIALDVTVSVAFPVTPLSDAVTGVEPDATAVANPAELIVATAAFPVVQLAVEVILAVEPSLYVAVALNCLVDPAAALAVPGDTEIAVIVFGVTVRVAVPLTPLIEAVTVVEPAAPAVARPGELTVATAVFAAVQLAVAVTFAVEPSLYVAVAVNCCVAPAAILGLPGEIAIEVTVFTAEVTESVAVPLRPLSEAVTVVEPAATPVANPAELIVVTDGVALVQLAVELTFAVEPSLYVAVAVNCCVAPTATLAVAGDTVIAVSVFGIAVSVAVPLRPLNDAVTVVEPADIPVAMPVELIVATAAFAAVQLAVEVTFAVEPLL